MIRKQTCRICSFAEEMAISTRCKFCGEYGEKEKPKICPSCWDMATEAVSENTELATTECHRSWRPNPSSMWRHRKKTVRARVKNRIECQENRQEAMEWNEERRYELKCEQEVLRGAIEQLKKIQKNYKFQNEVAKKAFRECRFLDWWRARSKTAQLAKSYQAAGGSDIRNTIWI